MPISNGRDKLQRIAFELSDGTFYKFAINPTNMTETRAARNTFTQTEHSVQMQGYGQGLHTIQISGTTGVNRGKGYDKLKELESLLVKQINSGHDVNTSAGATLSMKFHNFTNGSSWLVELNTDGFSITQSVENPLSYVYTISLVVVGEANLPKDSETSWVTLGNINPSVSPKQIDTPYNQRYARTTISGEYQGVQVKSLSDKLIRDSQTSVLAYNSFLTKASTDANNSVYQKLLSPNQIKAIYQAVYPDIGSGFDWSEYMNQAGLITKDRAGNIVSSGGDSNNTSVMSADEIYQTLRGQKVNGITIDNLDDAQKVHDMLYSNIVEPLSRDEYLNYVHGLKVTTTTGEPLGIMTPNELQATYQAFYGSSSPTFTNEGITDLAAFYGSVRFGSIDNLLDAINNGQWVSEDVTTNTVGSIYSILTGRTLDENDYSNASMVSTDVNDVASDSLQPYSADDQLSQQLLSLQYSASGVDNEFSNDWLEVTDSTSATRAVANWNNSYLNPRVSGNSPIYSYYETKNIMKV